MEQEAYVVGIEGNYIWVRPLRHSSCSNCGACNFGGRNEEEFLIPNTMDLSVGDFVKIRIDSKYFIKAVFLLYMIPLFFLFSGYYIGHSIMNKYNGNNWSEIVGLLLGIILFFLSYLGLRTYNNRIKASDKFQIKIIDIIKRNSV